MSSLWKSLAQLPESLRRVTSGSRYRPEVDGLRFIAIAIVIGWHFIERASRGLEAKFHQAGLQDELTNLTPGGNAGVWLFFSVSAFILAGQFAKRTAAAGWLKGYFSRRLTRIEPPYFIL